MATEKSDRLSKHAQELHDLLVEAAPFVEDNNYGTDAEAVALTKRIKKVIAIISGTYETMGSKRAKEVSEAFAAANGLSKPEPKPTKKSEQPIRPNPKTGKPAKKRSKK